MVKLRPHHLMCVHGFKGKGYSPEYVKNFWRVVEELKDPAAQVMVVYGEDKICEPCPNNNSGICTDEPKIQKLDNAYVATLEVKDGDVLLWDSVKKRIAEKVTDADFDKNCAPCSWKRLGFCKEALDKIRAGVLVLALCLGASHAAKAADEFSAPQIETVNNAGPIDVLESKLLLDKERRMPVFNKIMTALGKNDFKTALILTRKLENNPDYEDYYHFLSGQAEFGRMRKLMTERKYGNALLAGEQAAYHLNLVQGSNPYTTLNKRSIVMMGDAEVSLGDLYLKNKNRKKAREKYEKGFQHLASYNLLALSPKASVVNYALLCEKQKTDICTSWIIKLTPLVARTDDAKILERIAAFKRPVIERTTQTPYKVDLDLEAFTKAFALYRKGKYENAYGDLKDLLKTYPRTTIKLRTKFWMARCAQKANHNLEAETLYKEVIRELPFSYYALLSSWFGNIDLSRMMDAELPMASADSAQLSPPDIVHIRRAETFIASGAPELALHELHEVKATASMSNDFLVYLVTLNNLAGNHLAAFQILGELTTRNFQGLFSSYGQKLYFPTAKLPLVREIAKDYKLEPFLVLSVIKQESAFNPEAISVSPAYGLMQLIAPTARDLDPRIEIADLFNPARNIKLGTKYLRQLLGRYKGSVIPALAGYNAGPGNADRWVREAGPGLAPEEFVELITFRETREYVSNIMRNYYWYRRRVDGHVFPNLQVLTQAIR